MLSYKLEKFEGPLDLLLHLIEKNKVSIYDIPIFEITNQYMEYVNAMEEEDLDIVSEFLVMTATLLDIKSRLLLPAEKDENGDEIDPREGTDVVNLHRFGSLVFHDARHGANMCLSQIHYINIITDARAVRRVIIVSEHT